MKRNQVEMMPRYHFSLTRNLQTGACALAHLLLLVLAPWLHLHPGEDHEAAAGHAYHVHRVASPGQASPGATGQVAADTHGNEEGVALTPEEAFTHLLGDNAPLAAPPSALSGSSRSAVAGELPPLASIGEVQYPPPLLLVLSPRLSTLPGTTLSPGERILLLGTDLPPPAA